MRMSTRLRKKRRSRNAAGSGQLMTSPLRWIDPRVVGGPIEDILRASIAHHDDDTVKRLFGERDLILAGEHRILPIVREAWVEPFLREDLRREQREIAVFQMSLESELRSIIRLLDGAGIEFRVLKGVATGALDYPSPTMRHTSDIDLLVRPQDFESVGRLLEERGTREAMVAQDLDLDLGKGRMFLTSAGLEVDLHTRLNRYVSQDIELLMQSPELMSNGGAAMPKPLRLIHAAGHLIWTPFGFRRLSGLIDVGTILDAGVDPKRTASLASKLGVAGLVNFAVSLDGSLRSRNNPLALALPQASRLERVAFLRERRSIAAEHLLALQRVPTLRGKARYLHQFALPGGEVLEAAGGLRAYYCRFTMGGERAAD